ncbi:Hypothetical predicted protein, partial [Paramuricea clavata]
MSIDSDQFPSDWKAARVIPLFKKGQRSMLDNYRPISILPVVSKLMERIMYDQMYEYLNQNNFFSKHQFGFRPYHSTTTTLLDCTNEWKALNLLRCYLTHRTQSCQLASILSVEKEIICGIPQGSILGPLLFIMYINDLPSCLERTTPRMFADDTNLMAVGRTISEAEERANVDMRNVQKWLCANKLSLNIPKTESRLKADQEAACPWSIAYLKFIPTKSSDSFIAKPEKEHRSIVRLVQDRLSASTTTCYNNLKELAGKKLHYMTGVTCTEYVVRIWKVDVPYIIRIPTYDIHMNHYPGVNEK